MPPGAFPGRVPRPFHGLVPGARPGWVAPCNGYVVWVPVPCVVDGMDSGHPLLGPLCTSWARVSTGWFCPYRASFGPGATLYWGQ